MKRGRPRKEKHCGLCGTTDLAAFAKSKDRFDGLQGRCRECTRYAYFLKKMGLKPGPTARLSTAETEETRIAKRRERANNERILHPERVKQRHRRSRYKVAYGISLEDLEARIAAQHGLCPIGLHPFGIIGSHKDDSPCVDHDHATGEYRAILCQRHNLALGQFHDSSVELQAALEYLTLHTSMI